MSQEGSMGSEKDKIKGTANQALGRIKQGVGEATKNDELKSEGRVQEAKGVAQEAIGKAKAAIKKAADL